MELIDLAVIAIVQTLQKERGTTVGNEAWEGPSSLLLLTSQFIFFKGSINSSPLKACLFFWHNKYEHFQHLIS